MKSKRLLLASALALVIVGCVLAAGCTSTETTTATDASTDALVGVWYSDSVNQIVTKIILADGTGYFIWNNADGTSQAGQFTWSKNADGTYTFKWSDGSERTWTPTSAKDTMTSSSGATQIKKSLDEDAKNVLGAWYSKEKNYVTTFNADGTGITYTGEGNDISKFTWTVPETGKLKVTYQSGTLTNGTSIKGKVTEWTYDHNNDVLVTSLGTKYVRPTESVAGLTLTTFSTEPIVGQWTKKYQKDGKTVDAVMTFRNDGEGYWMALGDVEWIQVISYNKNSWTKIGENTYQVIASGGAYDGKVYEEVYDPTADTLTENGSAVYTRLEPIVGIWYGSFSKGDGGKTSTLFKPDGTGLMTLSYADKGTAEVVKETWKKNADGTYEITFSNGEKRTWAIDDTGTRVTSSSGSVKQKAFLDSTFLKSIVGAWYNKDNDVSYVFNADGTGFGSWENGDVLPFTWEAKGDGIFELTYISGTWSDGTSAKGKVTKWTYDRDNDVFTSSADIEYIRPTESVKDKITLY